MLRGVASPAVLCYVYVMVTRHRFLILLSFVALAGTAAAQDPSASGAPAKPALNADSFRLPSDAYDTHKVERRKQQPGTEPIKPGQFDLGDSVLQLDARRNLPSGVGIEAIDPKRLGGIRRDDSKPLNYFGMTLSK